MPFVRRLIDANGIVTEKPQKRYIATKKMQNLELTDENLKRWNLIHIKGWLKNGAKFWNEISKWNINGLVEELCIQIKNGYVSERVESKYTLS